MTTIDTNKKYGGTARLKTNTDTETIREQKMQHSTAENLEIMAEAQESCIRPTHRHLESRTAPRSLYLHLL